MNTFLQAAQNLSTTSLTENGDKTYTSSNDRCLDLFFQVAAVRGQPDKRVHELFAFAYGENPKLAAMIALWARDIRGGAGERQTFRYILQYLETYDPSMLLRILHKVPEVGRWDDLFSVMNTDRTARAVLEMYSSALTDKHGLACKWAPREDKDPKLAARIRNFMRLTPREYRKLVVAGTKVVEQQMCAKEWGEINYAHVPSVASARYGKAFGRHDNARYVAYLESVKKGDAKINTGAVYPYDCTKPGMDKAVADVMWKNLPDYVPEGLAFLPVIDVSGSMTSQAGGNFSCMDVAIALGIYLAERNKSAFKDTAITFSAKPSIFHIPPQAPIHTKVNHVRVNGGTGYNTNLDLAMKLVCDIGVKNNVPQSDMPDALIVLSDMEFDAGGYGNSGNVGVALRTQYMFTQAGYKVPNIVWWNIQSRGKSTPVRFDQKGMALVGGFSPAIVSSVLSGDIDPVKIMMKAVDKERYQF